MALSQSTGVRTRRTLHVLAAVLVVAAGALVARSFTDGGLGLAYASIAASALAALALAASRGR